MESHAYPLTKHWFRSTEIYPSARDGFTFPWSFRERWILSKIKVCLQRTCVRRRIVSSHPTGAVSTLKRHFVLWYSNLHILLCHSLLRSLSKGAYTFYSHFPHLINALHIMGIHYFTWI